jgi:hypothetical protein
MPGLKALVIIMGIMILAGFTLVVATIAHRLKHGETDAGVEAAVVGHASLVLPAGAHVEDMAATGTRLTLRVAAPGGKETLYVIEPSTGRLVETIALEFQTP